MATRPMKAQLTDKYTLYMDQITKPPADTPWAHEVPGTWVWWLLNQDFHFGHPGTDRIAEPRLRCNVLRTDFTLDPPVFVRLALGSDAVVSLLQRARW